MSLSVYHKRTHENQMLWVSGWIPSCLYRKTFELSEWSEMTQTNLRKQRQQQCKSVMVGRENKNKE